MPALRPIAALTARFGVLPWNPRAARGYLGDACSERSSCFIRGEYIVMSIELTELSAEQLAEAASGDRKVLAHNGTPQGRSSVSQTWKN